MKAFDKIQGEAYLVQIKGEVEHKGGSMCTSCVKGNGPFEGCFSAGSGVHYGGM